MSHIRFSSILAGAFLMFAMPVSAQAASYTYLDQKAPYTNPGMLTALNLPKVGATFKVQVPNGAIWWRYPFPYYIVAFGSKNPNLRVHGLGGWLFTSAEHVAFAPLNNNYRQTVTVSYPIPNSPQLVGVRFYQQVLQVFQGEFVPPTYLLSRGGVGVIGK
jgi:hypothetical protein